MRVSKDTIHLTSEEVNELLIGKEVKTQQGSMVMDNLNFLDPISQDPPIFHLGVTRQKLIMLREVGSVEHTYHKLILE